MSAPPMDRAKQRLEALRALAEKVPPGKLVLRTDEDDELVAWSDEYPPEVHAKDRFEHEPAEHFWWTASFRSGFGGPEIAALFIACDPATIRALVDVALAAMDETDAEQVDLHERTPLARGKLIACRDVRRAAVRALAAKEGA